jgi:hypothetical protein
VPTRRLAAQLIDHDLPRLAAIAVKLNEEEAPKFFAAFNEKSSSFETFAVDAKQKTTIRKVEFEAAIENIVNRRLAEMAVLIKEDTGKWLVAQGITGHTVPVEANVPPPRYALRKGLGIWKLVFDGQTVELKHEKGIFYVSYLLKNPPKEPIHALDLATQIPSVYRKQLGIAATVDPLTGEVVPLEKHSRIQERSTGLDDVESARAIWREEQKWEAVLEDQKATEPEKAEALRFLEQIAEFQKKHSRQTKSNADNLVRAVRRAITRFHDRLAEATRENGQPDPVCRAFAEHLQKHLLVPSARFSGRVVSRRRAGIAGCFTYEPPGGLTWAD